MYLHFLAVFLFWGAKKVASSAHIFDANRLPLFFPTWRFCSAGSEVWKATNHRYDWYMQLDTNGRPTADLYPDRVEKTFGQSVFFLPGKS